MQENKDKVGLLSLFQLVIWYRTMLTPGSSRQSAFQWLRWRGYWSSSLTRVGSADTTSTWFTSWGTRGPSLTQWILWRNSGQRNSSIRNTFAQGETRGFGLTGNRIIHVFMNYRFFLLINWKQDWLTESIHLYRLLNDSVIQSNHEDKNLLLLRWVWSTRLDWHDKIIKQIRRHCSASPGTTCQDKSEIQHQPSQGPTFPAGSQHGQVGGEK